MNKQYIFPFLMFFLVFIALFFGGLAGSIYSIRGLCLSISLNNSMETEKGIISHISKRYKKPNYIIHFSLENQTVVHKESVSKIMSNAKVGDEIQVVFNKKRNFFIIKDLIKATYISYITAMILCLIGFAISFMAGEVVIGLYGDMLNKRTGDKTA
jgi:hypothetical protein